MDVARLAQCLLTIHRILGLTPALYKNQMPALVGGGSEIQGHPMLDSKFDSHPGIQEIRKRRGGGGGGIRRGERRKKKGSILS